MFNSLLKKTLSLYSSKIHISQEKTFSQNLISVTTNDEYLGFVDRKSAHLNSYNKSNPPHRAFSVFVFDQNARLLLQQRSDIKITYPCYWTNTCCSHPLHLHDEMETKNNIGYCFYLYTSFS